MFAIYLTFHDVAKAKASFEASKREAEYQESLDPNCWELDSCNKTMSLEPSMSHGVVIRIDKPTSQVTFHHYCPNLVSMNEDNPLHTLDRMDDFPLRRQYIREQIHVGESQIYYHSNKKPYLTLSQHENVPPISLTGEGATAREKSHPHFSVFNVFGSDNVLITIALNETVLTKLTPFRKRKYPAIKYTKRPRLS